MSGRYIRRSAPTSVAIGIALDVIYSRRMGYLDRESEGRILSLLDLLGFELFANELVHTEANNKFQVLNGLEEFREHLGGELTITLLRKIGEGFEVHSVDLPQMLQAIGELESRHREKSLDQASAGA